MLKKWPKSEEEKNPTSNGPIDHTYDEHTERLTISVNDH